MSEELTSKQRQNRRLQLAEFISAWNQLYCIVHDKDLVMYKRKNKDGVTIRYLDFRK